MKNKKEELQQSLNELGNWIRMVRVDRLVTKLGEHYLAGTLLTKEAVLTIQQQAVFKQFLADNEKDLMAAVALFQAAVQKAMEPIQEQ